VNAPSSGLTAQQQLNMYANAWHTEGWWALAFAAAAVLSGAGALLLPRILRSGGALNVSYVNGQPVVRGRYGQRIKIIDGVMYDRPHLVRARALIARAKAQGAG